VGQKETYSLNNSTIIDFHTLFLRKIEGKIINDYNDYGLIAKKLRLNNKDTRNLLLHHVIFELCQYILSKKSGRHVIFCSLDHKSLAGSQFLTLNLIDPSELNTFLVKKLQRLSKILPIRFIFSDNIFNNYVFELQTCRGQREELNMFIDSTDNKFMKYRFDKLLQFAKRFNLTFLSEDYFKQIKNKLLLIR
jgi:hypothetical protein